MYIHVVYKIIVGHSDVCHLQDGRRKTNMVTYLQCIINLFCIYSRSFTWWWYYWLTVVIILCPAIRRHHHVCLTIHPSVSPSIQQNTIYKSVSISSILSIWVELDLTFHKCKLTWDVLLHYIFGCIGQGKMSNCRKNQGSNIGTGCVSRAITSDLWFSVFVCLLKKLLSTETREHRVSLLFVREICHESL